MDADAIINEYIKIFNTETDTILNEPILSTESVSLYYLITTTNLGIDFSHNDTIYGDIQLTNFASVYVLFNDLVGSTKIIEELEKRHGSKGLKIYALYIGLSTKMLAEILDKLGGTMIECTGDGNYSILPKDTQIAPVQRCMYGTKEDRLANSLSHDFSNYFAQFNRNLKINKELCNKFQTRVGCAYGECKIVNIEAKGHIKQHKLIGKVVHDAAHQAQGK